MFDNSREAFMLYKYAYDVGLKVNKDISMDLFEEGLAIEVLCECLDAVPLLTYDVYGCFVDDRGVEHEDANIFKLSHPLIVELGEFEKKIKRGHICLKKLKTKDMSIYTKLQKLLKREQSLIDSICSSFYMSSVYFSFNWHELHIVHEAHLECCDLFISILEYLELLKEMIPLIRHISNRLL